MVISERQLKELVLRILKELAEEKIRSPGHRQKLYMLCTSERDVRYQDFMFAAERSGQYDICPVIPDSWRQTGDEAVFKKYKCCCQVRYHSDGKPADLDDTVTVFPVTERDVIVKTALCISDTFETSWVTDCMEQGSRIVFLRSGLRRFSGRETPAYIRQLLSYCRTVLEYGIEIGSMDELFGVAADRQSLLPVSHGSSRPDHSGSFSGRQEPGCRRKRVITAANVEQFVTDGILSLQPGDIMTDLAKDRAKFLNVVISEQDSEVIE